MKVLVTGVAGQLGYDVVNELNKRNIDVIGTDIKDESDIDSIVDIISISLTRISNIRIF